MGLFHVKIIVRITINPGRNLPRNWRKVNPGLRSVSIRKKNNPTIMAKILGA